jgi:hypothetical protein
VFDDDWRFTKAYAARAAVAGRGLPATTTGEPATTNDEQRSTGYRGVRGPYNAGRARPHRVLLRDDLVKLRRAPAEAKDDHVRR